MTSLPNPNQDFRIDEPGNYINKLGDIKITERWSTQKRWRGLFNGKEYHWYDNGRYIAECPTDMDIIAKAPAAAGEDIKERLVQFDIALKQAYNNLAAGEGLPFSVPGFVKLRDGNKAYVAGKSPAFNDIDPQLCGIADDGEDVSAYSWYMNGKYYSDGQESPKDIIAPWRDPVVVDRWVNIYDHYGYSTKSEADNGQGYDRKYCVHIRITDGKAEIIPENGDE